MLVTSTHKLQSPQINIITLFKDGYYFYVDRNLYDQAVILNYKFKNDLNFFKDIFGKDFTKEVNMFLESAPEPINILGPYLLLIESGDLDLNIEMLTGALHQVFTVINALKVITVPAEMRASVGFTLSIYEEYTPSWDAFLLECSNAARQASTPVSTSTPSVSSPSVSTSTSTSTEPTASFATSYDIDMDGWDLDLDDGYGPDEETTETKSSGYEPEPEPAKKDDGLDFLRRNGLIPKKG